MSETNKFKFQYCQKIVIFSKDFKKVLLCKRKGEADYDGVYSFVGGKMEVSDKDLISGLKREKDEELGEDFKIQLYTLFSTNLNFRKKSGDHMVLPHYLARHLKGDIKLSKEYSEYKWVKLEEIEDFEPKIDNIPETINILLKLRAIIKDSNIVVI